MLINTDSMKKIRVTLINKFTGRMSVIAFS